MLDPTLVVNQRTPRLPEPGPEWAARHLAAFDKQRGHVDDTPWIGCDSPADKTAYRAAYRRANPRRP